MLLSRRLASPRHRDEGNGRCRLRSWLWRGARRRADSKGRRASGFASKRRGGTAFNDVDYKVDYSDGETSSDEHLGVARERKGEISHCSSTK